MEQSRGVAPGDPRKWITLIGDVPRYFTLDRSPLKYRMAGYASGIVQHVDLSSTSEVLRGVSVRPPLEASFSLK